MNKLLVGSIGLVAFMVIIIPGIVVLLWLNPLGGLDKMAPKEKDVTISVYRQDLKKIEKMPLEEYLKGVLGAEMPAAFEMEALKAQAVAARTYAVKSMHAYGGAGSQDHPEADVSTDFNKSQAWLDQKTLKERWGKKYDQYSQKISKAVESTRGEIAVYDDKPISAVFHSTSGDHTASAKEVWGNDLPYLQSVECHWDKASPRYKEEKTVTLSELSNALGEDAIAASVMYSGSSFMQIISLTESGRVKEIKIGDKTFSGQDIRNKLGLRSENFTVEQSNNGVTFATIGYGHGVGLCQYGANGMAKEGKSYKDILKYYYTGIDLKNIND